MVLDCASSEQIHDIKVVKGDKAGVLAVTETTFHQFWGNTRNSIGEILVQSEINSEYSRARRILDEKADDHKKSDFATDPKLRVHENLDESVNSVGWQAHHRFYFFDFGKDEEFKGFLHKKQL